MGLQREAQYYDAIWATRPPGAGSFGPSVWEAVVRLCAGITEFRDVGCGPGGFAKFLAATLGTDVRYTGYDFSTVAVDNAKKMGLSGYAFIVTDIVRDPTLFTVERPEATAFVFLEVLEHLHDDLDLLARVPPTAMVVLTVPDFDDPGHVRWFSNLKSVEARYCLYVDKTAASVLYTQKHFLLAGRRNAFEA